MRKTPVILAIAAAFALAGPVAADSAAPQDAKTTTQMDSKANKAEIPAGPTVDIVTSEGPIKIRLYDDTPAHRDNFLKLASEGFYDGVLFHRVIKDFMVQTGDPESK